MYFTLLILHSVVRWLVLISLVYSVLIALRGIRFKTSFSKTDNATRHYTATIAHIQLVIGIILYSQSPLVKYFFKNGGHINEISESLFFGVIHIMLMLFAIVLITIGSALAKRRLTDLEKFRTMLVWFFIALIIIFIAIPWPFSPLASRPYLQTF